MHLHTPPPQRICAGCSDPLDLDAAYFLFLGTDHPMPMCEECARWHTEGFLANACILEAHAIIRATHARLNAALAMEQEVRS